MSYARTLILDVDYTPYEVLDWKEAVSRMFAGKIQVLSQYREVLAHITRQTLSSYPALRSSLRSLIGTDVESFDICVPAVAVRTQPARRTKPGNKFSKYNVRLRDKFTCQYCGKKYASNSLNVDHIIPKSLGGHATWENIALSCFSCNAKKANRTPNDAGMTLLTKPVVPRTLPIVRPRITKTGSPEEWWPFLGDAV